QYNLFTYAEALDFVDLELISLLIGVMIVVEVADRGGLFRFGALYSIRASKGKPRRLFVMLCLTAAAASLFLSDATAMLFIAAATITITKLLDYDPMPYFLSAAV
ncbi:MAG: hypothetical protein GTO54_10650, partial [Nitrososphaeria archaeon]|nr:hypothetical protein [Nitrososphaeria archaeon]